MTAHQPLGSRTRGAHDVTDAITRIAAAVQATDGSVEAIACLPDSLVADLRDTGVVDMWLPCELGGAEVPPPEVFDPIEHLARSDGSTGWCAAVSVGTTALAAYLPEEGARQIFSAPASITGADWLCGGCMIVDEAGDPVVTPEGRPDVRLAFFPARDAVIHDTWRAMECLHRQP